MSGKLHEVLAVEADRESLFKQLLEETDKVFRKRQDIFQGAVKETRFNKEEDGQDVVDRLDLTTTVGEKLACLSGAVSLYLDTVYQKDAANQEARANLEINGQVLAKNVPATYLLGLEQKLRKLREVYKLIPTLATGIAWKKDETAGKGVYRMEHPEVRAKTAKRPMHRVLVQPTKEHPAQVEKWNEDVQVGTITVHNMSGMLSSRAKSDILSRLDALIQGAKRARMRANMVEAKPVNMGAVLLNFIHGSSLE